MNGYEALLLTLDLMDDGMDPNEAAECAIETMAATNSGDPIFIAA